LDASKRSKDFFVVPQFKSALIIFVFVALGLPCVGQTPLPTPVSSPGTISGTIVGTIVDQTGAVVAGARVSLTRISDDKDHDKDQIPTPDVLSGDNGQFSFASVPPGPFQLTITAAGFTSQTASGILHSGESCTVPQIALAVALNITDVEVSLSRIQVAEEQIKDEEKQRVFGFIPNFYVTYDPHPVALTSKQKFELAWKTTIDPVTFAIVGGIAGVQQAQNAFSGYGQGAQGYAKRYGSTYGNLVTGTFIGSAILPSLFKQDPRYFYKGTGTKQSRILYAIANSVICKGDNGHWQTNYSNILGSLAAGAISNLYYPAENRNGAALTFENTAIGIGATAAANLIEEFLMRKLTSNVPSHAKP
jgi:Carboxypeptidase regulatory-like domain